MKEGDRQLAVRILRDATTKLPNVYSSSFFVRRHISIVDQQLRAFELVHALFVLGKIKPHHHVAVVGGGFAGMTAAVALAARSSCIVHVFERSSVLLERFRQAPFRYLHPYLNSGLHDDYEYNPEQETDFPFLNWSANHAHLVAEQFCRRFNHYVAASTIAVHLDENVERVIRGIVKRPMVVLRRPGGEKQFQCDVAILATGFGPERVLDTARTNDISYWYSGRPTDYRPTKAPSGRKERVLIVGNGDSAVVELAHYLIKGFNHRWFSALSPTRLLDGFLPKAYSQQVQRLHYRKIERPDEEYPDVEGPIGWYWSWRDSGERNNHFPWVNRPPAVAKLLKRIYRTIDAEFGDRPIGAKLSRKAKASVLASADRHLDDLASVEIEQLIDNYKYQLLFKGPEHPALFTDAFDVTMAGRSRTMFSRSQAPLNWFVLGYCRHFGRFSYVRADGDKRAASGQFDRVVVRKGPAYDSLQYKCERRTSAWTQWKDDTPTLFDWIRRSGKYEDQLFAAFRTRRLRRMQNHLEPLEDPASSDVPELHSERTAGYTVLNLCLRSPSLRLRRKLTVLFRTIRTERSSDKRLEASITLDKTAARIYRRTDPVPDRPAADE